MGADGVVRDVQLAGDLRPSQVGRQVAQHPQLAVAQRLQQRLQRGGPPGELAPGEQAEDVADQGGVRGALPGVALKEIRGGAQQENCQRAVGFGTCRARSRALAAPRRSPSASRAIASSRNG